MALTYGADMADWLSGAGSILGGAGQLAGAFGLGRSGGPDIGAQQQFSMQQLQMQQQFQRDMAQNSIQWRVDDARRAGISPITALGAPTFNPGGVSIGNIDYGTGGRGFDPAGFGAGGQRLADGINKIMTPADKASTTQAVIEREQRTRSNELDIQIKAAQLARIQQEMRLPSQPMVSGAGGPLSGQGNSPITGQYKIDPVKVESQPDATPTVLAGPPQAATLWARTPTGVKPNPNPKLIQDTDIFNPEYGIWAWQNYVAPNANRAPTVEYLRQFFPGAVGVRWNQYALEYQPVYPQDQRSPAPYPSPQYDRRR